MTASSPSRPAVTVYEVGPRDGLQNEREPVGTAVELELLRRLAASALGRIEATSFVSAEWIPQLADADAVASALPTAPSVAWSALVPNEAGYARLRAAARIGVAALFVSASETHNRRNVNRGIAEHLERLARVRADGVALLEAEGFTTGIDLDVLVDASAWLERDVLRRPLPGRVTRARLAARERALRSAHAGGSA